MLLMAAGFPDVSGFWVVWFGPVIVLELTGLVMTLAVALAVLPKGEYSHGDDRLADRCVTVTITALVLFICLFVCWMELFGHGPDGQFLLRQGRWGLLVLVPLAAVALALYCKKKISAGPFRSFSATRRR
jgi:hypothetical protein